MARCSLEEPQNCGIGYFSTPVAAWRAPVAACSYSTRGTLIDLKPKKSQALPYEGCSER